MKKIILSAIAIFTIGFANAQETKFGAKVALNVATLNGFDNSKSKIGFAVGGFVEIKVSDKFSVQPELLYSLQGVKSSTSFNSSGNSFTQDENISLSYINIPVMAKYYVTEGLSLEAGPQIGFLVSLSDKNTTSSTIGGSTYSSETTTSSTDNSNTVDFGLNFGAGYDFTKNISIGLRYNLGLNKLNKNSVSGISDIKNSVFQIGVGYKF